MTLYLYTDGGSRGNPGPAGAGMVVTDAKGNVLVKQAVFLGVKTNNQAEYYGLLKGIGLAKPLGNKITCRLDSQLVVRQMRGEYKIKDAILREMAQEIARQCVGMEVEFEHIYREQNTVADAMANLAMDRGKKPGETFTFQNKPE